MKKIFLLSILALSGCKSTPPTIQPHVAPFKDLTVLDFNSLAYEQIKSCANVSRWWAKHQLTDEQRKKIGVLASVSKDDAEALEEQMLGVIAVQALSKAYEEATKNTNTLRIKKAAQVYGSKYNEKLGVMEFDTYLSGTRYSLSFRASEMDEFYSNAKNAFFTSRMTSWKNGGVTLVRDINFYSSPFGNGVKFNTIQIKMSKTEALALAERLYKKNVNTMLEVKTMGCDQESTLQGEVVGFALAIQGEDKTFFEWSKDNPTDKVSFTK